MIQTPLINDATAPLADAEAGASLAHDAWLRLHKNRLAVFGGAALVTASESTKTSSPIRAGLLVGAAVQDTLPQPAVRPRPTTARPLCKKPRRLWSVTG